MKKEIRIINPENSQIIVNLEEKSFDHPWTEDQIQSDMTHHFSQFRVLEVDGKDVGYANIWLIDGDMELNRICIAPEFRRQGYAEFIMYDLLSLCYENNLERIILEVAADNKPAIALYDKFDFKDIHIRERYYDNGADALIKVRITDDN